MSDLNALNLEPGEVVGGYTLVSRLGAGAMGSVWRVHDDGGTSNPTSRRASAYVVRQWL